MALPPQVIVVLCCILAGPQANLADEVAGCGERLLLACSSSNPLHIPTQASSFSKGRLVIPWQEGHHAARPPWLQMESPLSEIDSKAHGYVVGRQLGVSIER